MTRAAIIALVAFGSIAGQYPVGSPDDKRPAVVIGRVVDAATGQGVRRAVVRITTGGRTRTSLADDRGRFFFIGLSAGQYDVTARRDGYFDGATEETVHKVKKPRSPEARFGAVCKNFRNMVALRDARGSRCRISMKVVLDQDNYHEVEQCVQLAMDLRADSVQFKAARLTPTELTPAQADQVNAAIVHCKTQYAGRMIVIGGVGSVRGAFIAAILVGLVDTLGRSFGPMLLSRLMEPSAASQAGRTLMPMLIYILMAAVLFLRPAGLFPASGTSR